MGRNHGRSIGLRGRTNPAGSDGGRLARRAVPGVERLEGRSLLAASITLTGAHLIDSSDHPIAAPVTGEEVFLEADWTTSGLTSSDHYLVSFTVDGVTLSSTSQTGQSGNGLSYYWYLGGWYASAGSHSVNVVVDPTHAVSEANESSNSTSFSFSPIEPTSLPSKLIEPIGGIPYQTWSFVNYIDVDPLPTAFLDYKGGSFTYDGHGGYDTTLGGDFAAMDAGVPIFAAAPGVITQVGDGNFDRQTGTNTAQANYLVEDFGNGWTAEYYHLLNTSKAVQVGQAVAAGQLLGLVGSSGDSSDAHLHFDLQHDGDYVETYDEPAAYWVSPLAYQGSVPATVIAQGITNASPFADAQEAPVSIAQFPTTSSSDVWYWYRLSYLKPTDTLAINWYRPDGSLATTFSGDVTSEYHYSFAGWEINPATYSAYPGTWHVEVVDDGKQIGTQSFQVTSGAGLPRIKLYDGDTYVLNGRTTPLDLGMAAQGAAAPRLTFTVNNVGSTTLNLASVSVPPGFSMAGRTTTSIAPGASAGFTVILNTSAVGPQFGQVVLATNDPASPTLKFNVSGTITGTLAPGSPTSTLTPASLATDLESAPRAIDPGLTFTDTLLPSFANGLATATIASGGTINDQLALVNQGTGPGQIGLAGTTVSFAGTPIGVETTSSNPATVSVGLFAAATPAAVQALLRDVTYVNTSTTPSTAPRYVRFSVLDGNAVASNNAIKTVIDSGVNRPPTAPSAGGPYTLPEGGSLTLTASPATDVDGDALTYSWDVNGDGVYGDAVGLNPTLTWAQLNALGIHHGSLTLNNVRVEVSDGVNAPVVSGSTSLTVTTVLPVVTIGSPSTSTPAGLTFADAGLFTDPGDGPWTATVNYGDGTSTQTLALNADKSFALGHVYAGAGADTITVSVTDADGQVGVGTVNITVMPSQMPTKPSSGGPYAVTEGGTLQLAGSPSTDGTGNPLVYSWDVNGDGVYGDAVGLTPSLTWGQVLALGLGHASAKLTNVRIEVSDGLYAPVVSDPTSLTITVTPPTVTLGASATLPQGGSFARSGQFSGPADGPWTATVNYGDGTGAQPLALNADKSFSLAHTYLRAGTFNLTVAVTDANQVAGAASLALKVQSGTAADYNGAGKTDDTIYDPTSATFYALASSGIGFVKQVGSAAHANIPLAGDYDGDGKSDYAVYDPTNATFYVVTSSGLGSVKQLGNAAHANIPLAGDYDGDGKTDFAIFDPTTSTFYVVTSTGLGTVKQLGNAAHANIPLAGDYDGDGKADYAVYDPTNATFYVLTSSGSVLVKQLGNAAHANIPLAGDYDGDGKSDFAIYDQTSATFYVLTSSGSVLSRQLGSAAHANIPLDGDYDGDGKADFSIYDPTSATFYVVSATGAGVQQLGTASHANIPLPGTILPSSHRTSGGSAGFRVSASSFEGVTVPGVNPSGGLVEPARAARSIPIPAGPMARANRPGPVAQEVPRVRYLGSRADRVG